MTQREEEDNMHKGWTDSDWQADKWTQRQHQKQEYVCTYVYTYMCWCYKLQVLSKTEHHKLSHYNRQKTKEQRAALDQTVLTLQLASLCTLCRSQSEENPHQTRGQRWKPCPCQETLGECLMCRKYTLNTCQSSPVHSEGVSCREKAMSYAHTYIHTYVHTCVHTSLHIQYKYIIIRILQVPYVITCLYTCTYVPSSPHCLPCVNVRTYMQVSCYTLTHCDVRSNLCIECGCVHRTHCYWLTLQLVMHKINSVT